MNWTNPSFEALAHRVGARTGLIFEPGRRAGIELGVRRVMARAGVETLERYGELIEADAGAMDDLIAELTVGETYFFREPDQFRFLRRTVLPEIQRCRGGDVAPRAWSAGCASGEEAYSLAIVLAEEMPAARFQVLATDISRTALARARLANYGAWSLRGEGADAARPYLRPVGERFEVIKAIRSRVVFLHLNLASDDYPAIETGTMGLDLIFCRNVLIYLDPGTVQAVARRLHAALADGGWLITASSDPPLAPLAPFESVVTEHGVFYRRGEATGVRGAVRFDDSGDSILGDIAPRTWAEPTAEPRADERSEAVDGGCDSKARCGNAAILEQAVEELASGQYARAAERAGLLAGDPEADALRVRSLANLDTWEAERACADAAAQHPLSCELHHLRAVLLLDLGRAREAVEAARRVVYLDRSLAFGHITLGSALSRSGDPAGARRAYRNARDLCAARPAGEIVPLSDGETAGRLAEAAGAMMAQWDSPSGGAR